MSAKIFAQVLDHSKTTGSKRLIMCVLADAANSDGVTWVYQETIAFRARLGLSTVERIIPQLEADGELEIRKAQRGRKRVNVYRVNVPGRDPLDLDKLPFKLVEPFNDDPSDRGAVTATTSQIEGSSSSDTALSIGPVSKTLRPTAGGEIERPAPVKIQGRDIALDALVEVCGIDPAARYRVKSAAGVMNQKDGIRDLFWIECVRAVEDNPDRAGMLEELVAHPDRYEVALAERIRVKAKKARAREPWRQTLAPWLIRDIWLDVELTATESAADRVKRVLGDV